MRCQSFFDGAFNLGTPGRFSADIIAVNVSQISFWNRFEILYLPYSSTNMALGLTDFLCSKFPRVHYKVLLYSSVLFMGL